MLGKFHQVFVSQIRTLWVLVFCIDYVPIGFAKLFFYFFPAHGHERNTLQFVFGFSKFFFGRYEIGKLFVQKSYSVRHLIGQSFYPDIREIRMQVDIIHGYKWIIVYYIS